MTIELNGLNRFRSSSLMDQISVQFRRFLAGLQRECQQSSTVEINLTKPGWISAAELVLTACQIRVAAEAGTTIRIKLPEDINSSVTWFFYNFRFPHALGYQNEAMPWHTKIDFMGYGLNTFRKSSPNRFRNIVPIQWIDSSAFTIGEKDKDLFAYDPVFYDDYVRRLENLLTREFHLSRDTIDQFIDGLLKEIGWNSVLHGRSGDRGSFGAFAGQLDVSSRSLDFVISDLGCGIEENLGKTYQEALARGTAENFRDYFESMSSTGAVVRYAFEPDSTHREKFPTTYESYGLRGLSLVSEIIRDSGSLALASGDAIVEINSISRNFSSYIFPGEVLVGTTALGRINKSVTSETQECDDKNEMEHFSRQYIVSVSAILEQTRDKNNDERILEILDWIRTNYTVDKILAVDFGYCEPTKKFVEALIANTIVEFKLSKIRISSIKSPNISVQGILRLIRVQNHSLPFQMEYLRDLNDIANFDFTKTILAGKLPEDGLRWKAQSVNLGSVNEYLFLVNNIYVDLAFTAGFSCPGFRSGNIHLLNGMIANKYFSLVEYLEDSLDTAGRRWSNTLECLIASCAQEAELRNFKVLGFSASVRPILEHLSIEGISNEDIVYISSYDVPSATEIATYISPGDNVVLVTDVVSSGTLIDMTVNEIFKLDARIMGIVALVYARKPLIQSWASLQTPKNSGIPYYVGCTLERTLQTQKTNGLPEFWVDDVSAVTSTAPEGLPISESKIQNALELLSNSETLRLGHFESGLRHCSIGIDLNVVFEQEALIEHWTKDVLDKQLSSEEWSNFAPEIALVPDGIDRLGTVAASNISTQTSKRFAEIVSSLLASKPEVRKLQRTYSPSGRSRCAPIDYLSGSHDIFDVVIVDDAISSGSTLQSIVSQAVRSGAQRVLVVVLLARASIDDLQFWQTINTVSHLGGEGSKALIATLYPLHLPINFDNRAQCPQCSTLATLENRSNKATKRGWEDISADLEKNKEYLPDVDNIKLYKSLWLELHSLAKLATSSHTFLEKFRNRIGALMDSEAQITKVARAVLIRLFLVEWQLRETARLRLVVNDLIIGLAIEQIENNEDSDQLLKEALSLLRSVSPETYLDQLANNIDAVTRTETVFNRVLFHLVSLIDNRYPTDNESLIERLYNRISESNLGDHQKQRCLEALTEQLPRVVTVTTTPEKARELALRLTPSEELNRSQTHRAIAHDIASKLRGFRKLSSISVEEKSVEYWQSQSDSVKDINKNLEKHIFPFVSGLNDIVKKALSDLELFDKMPANYLDIGGNEGNIRSEMKLLEESLCIDSLDNVSTRAISRALNYSRRAYDAFFEKNAIVLMCLEHWMQYQPMAALSSLKTFFSSEWPAATIDVDCSEFDSRPNVVLFASPSILYTFRDLVRSNIVEHVLDKGVNPDELLLKLVLLNEKTYGADYAKINVLNNVSSDFQPKPMKFNSRLWNRSLSKIEAEFIPYQRVDEPYGAMATLKLRLVKGWRQLNEDTNS